MTKDGQHEAERRPGKAMRRERSAAVPAEPGISKQLVENLCEIARSIECIQIGSRAWNHLAKPQRDRLIVRATKICRGRSGTAADEDAMGAIEPFELCYQYLHGAFGVWMHAHGVSQWEAIISLSRKLGRLSDDDAKDLWRQISDKPTGMMPGFFSKPTWIKERRELWLDDELMRTITSDRPTTVEAILDAFEASGWTGAIQWPPSTPEEKDAPATTSRGLSDLIRSLNKGLMRIRFTAQASTISWTHVL